MKLIAVAACLVLLGDDFAIAHEVSPERLTPIVLAVRKARVSVVSIKGQKTVTEPAEGATADASEAPRQVNGMGTGKTKAIALAIATKSQAHPHRANSENSQQSRAFGIHKSGAPEDRRRLWTAAVLRRSLAGR